MGGRQELKKVRHVYCLWDWFAQQITCRNVELRKTHAKLAKICDVFASNWPKIYFHIHDELIARIRSHCLSVKEVRGRCKTC